MLPWPQALNVCYRSNTGHWLITSEPDTYEKVIFLIAVIEFLKFVLYSNSFNLRPVIINVQVPETTKGQNISISPLCWSKSEGNEDPLLSLIWNEKRWGFGLWGAVLVFPFGPQSTEPAPASDPLYLLILSWGSGVDYRGLACIHWGETLCDVSFPAFPSSRPFSHAFTLSTPNRGVVAICNLAFPITVLLVRSLLLVRWRWNQNRELLFSEKMMRDRQNQEITWKWPMTWSISSLQENSLKYCT